MSCDPPPTLEEFYDQKTTYRTLTLTTEYGVEIEPLKCVKIRVSTPWDDVNVSCRTITGEYWRFVNPQTYSRGPERDIK